MLFIEKDNFLAFCTETASNTNKQGKENRI